MKKLVVSMFFMVAASFFIVCSVSADSKVQFSLDPGETMVVYLDNTYSFEVPGNSKGDYGFFNWTVSETPIGHTGLIKSSVVNYAGASMPNITVSAQRDNVYSGNFTFMFDSNVGSGSTVHLYLSIAVTLQNLTDNTISGYMGLTFSRWNYSASNIPNTGTLNDKLDQILNALGAGGFGDYLGSDALVYFRKDYFSELWANQSVLPNSDGLFVVPSISGCSKLTFTNNSMAAFSISPGTYLVSFTAYFSNQPTSISFLGNPLEKFECVADWQFSNLYRVCGIFTVDSFSTYREVSVSIEGATFNSGIFYGGVSRASDDTIASGAINPDQSGLVSDVDNAGQQQQQQEDKLWANINSYKGDLTFNLDDWSEAAGGLSYVSGIFMSIWNNSPTQIIVLSLMLGIAMLSIGRGAMAAVRVSRNRRDDD